VVEHLFHTATRRLRKTHLATALDRHFGAAPDHGRHPFVNSVEWVTLSAGELLFAEGDEADAAYVVVSGRLRQVDTEDPGGSRSRNAFLTEFGAGGLGSSPPRIGATLAALSLVGLTR
jgi:CRP-like cAMP-binding protein